MLSMLAMLVLSLAAGPLPVRVPVAYFQQPQPDPAQGKPEKRTPDSSQQPAAAPADSPAPVAPAKPADRPKKVITNDDLKHAGSGGGLSPADFGAINDCNRSCFEQVRQQAHIIPSTNPTWKRDLLQSIEQVRKDNEWQQYLRDLYDAHLKFCNLGVEKREELAKHADPNNVTPRELDIDEKYDAKFNEAQNTLRALYSRQAGLQRKFLGYPFAYQFTSLQASRIQTASCYVQGSRYSPTDADDP